MPKSRHVGECAYCGTKDVAVSHDHVVNKGLWKKGSRPKHPIMVWACEDCHDACDKHFEYFRSNLLTTAEPDNKAAWDLFDTTVKKSLGRPQLNRMLLDSILSGRDVWAPNEKGVLVQRVAMKIYTAEHYMTVFKMVRGLHFHHYHESVEPSRVGAQDVVLADQSGRDKITTALRTLPFRKVQHLGDGIDTFCYRLCDARELDVPVDTIWALRLLGHRIFMAYIKSSPLEKNQN